MDRLVDAAQWGAWKVAQGLWLVQDIAWQASDWIGAVGCKCGYVGGKLSDTVLRWGQRRLDDDA